MPTPDTSHISPVWSRVMGEALVVRSGEGAYLYTEDGRKLLDFTCGIAVTNTGHAHPRVVKAIQEQAAKLIHGQVNIVYHEPMLELSRELLTILPPKLDSFFLANSGAEIVEAAVKLVKQTTRRPNIIVFSGSFHGRTHLTMAMTNSKTTYRAGYQPLVSGIFAAPFPYTYRYGWDEETTITHCLKELKLLLKTQTAPEETAAIVIEPVLGEGGYVAAPARFLQELRGLCDHYGILLVADEVQTGFGRTGKWLACEHAGIVPDVVCLAKGIASGMPLSVLATSSERMQQWPVGSHGGTYGGNAVACAAAVATIQTMREEQLLANAERMGKTLIVGLRKLQEDYPEIGDVRGVGLMVATEFTSAKNEPWAERAKAVTRAALKEGLMLLTCGPYENTVRWIPPLIITEEQIKEALRMFAAALKSSQ